MRFALSLALAVTVATASTVSAAPPTSQPSILDGVGVDQHPGVALPLDLPFRDEQGRTIALRDCFHGRPVIFTLVYFQCPMLCTVTLNQLTRSLTAMHESAGRDFDVVAVSFDPRETPTLAAAKKQTYLRAYRRESAEAGMHFLTGDVTSIDAITHGVGFHYRWDDAQQMFAHPAATMIVSPDGHISRYFLSVDYPPTELEAALGVAKQGVTAAPAESVYFYCVKYDPETGRYGLLIGRTLRALAGASVLGVVGLIVTLQSSVARRVRLQPIGGVA